jgi:tetratricopeptide (TPR) repeat protein
MNRQQFIDYIKSPASLNADSAIQLDNLVKEYPYCQTVDVLFTLNLYKENHFKFNDQLKLASAYACDRKVLKELVNAVRSTAQTDSSVTTVLPGFKPQIRESKSLGIEENNLSSLFHLLKDEVNSIKDKPSKKAGASEYSKINNLVHQLEGILQELEEPGTQKPELKQPVTTLLGEYNMDHLEDLSADEKPRPPENDLIDKFLENKPQIEAVSKTGFYDPVDHARQSLIDNESVVSETLAEIYYKQGNLSKAIKIYKKLSLVNPGKSSFFAAQIEKIRKEIK